MPDMPDDLHVREASVRVTGRQLTLDAENAQLSLTTRRFARGADEADLGGVRMWHLQDGDGVEEGWDLATRPAGDGALVLDVDVDGADVHPESDTSVVLVGDAGGIYRYSGLVARDATGAALPAWMEPTSTGLRILVDDAGATWPLTVDPILTSIGVVLGDLGYASEPIGDVNGDGYAELLLSTGGSPRLVYGALGGPPSLTWVDLTDPSVDGVTYRSDAAGGDLNGDGYDDVVVSGWSFSTDGSLSIHYGGPTGVQTTAAMTIMDTGGDFGYSVDVGDFNADGYADIATGGNQKVSVYYGSPSGPPSSPSVSLNFFTRQFSCYELEAKGDYNGDGFDDLAVGAPATDVGGSVLIYLGGVHGLNNLHRPIRLNNTLGSGLYGNALDAGDFNNDGRDDLLVGARDYSDNRGAIFLYKGSSALGVVPTAVWSDIGPSVGAYYGLVLTFLGDTNSDGRADFAMSKANDSSGGIVMTYDGTPSGVPGSASTTVTGSSVSLSSYGDDGLGWNLQGPGDMNGDGKGDLDAGAASGSSGYINANFLFWGG